MGWKLTGLLLFSRSVVSDSLWPHGLPHAGLHCPHYLPEFAQTHVYFSQWCHPTISSSVAAFSSCLQSFPASGTFPESQLFPFGGQSTGASTSSAPVLLMGIQGWFPEIRQCGRWCRSQQWYRESQRQTRLFKIWHMAYHFLDPG